MADSNVPELKQLREAFPRIKWRQHDRRPSSSDWEGVFGKDFVVVVTRFFARWNSTTYYKILLERLDGETLVDRNSILNDDPVSAVKKLQAYVNSIAAISPILNEELSQENGHELDTPD